MKTTATGEELRQAGLHAASELVEHETRRSLGAMSVAVPSGGVIFESDEQRHLVNEIRVFRSLLEQHGLTDTTDTQAILELFDEFVRVPNTNLISVPNHGSWRATDQAEQELKLVPAFLAGKGYEVEVFDRDSEGAKLETWIIPGLISDDDHVAVYRKRRVIRAVRPDSGSGNERRDIDVDKVSVFALRVDKDTPREIGLIIASRFRQMLGPEELSAIHDLMIGLDSGDSAYLRHELEDSPFLPFEMSIDYEALRIAIDVFSKLDKMVKLFNITNDELENGHDILSSREAQAHIENLIDRCKNGDCAGGDLIPAVTNYYAHS